MGYNEIRRRLRHTGMGSIGIRRGTDYNNNIRQRPQQTNTCATICWDRRSQVTEASNSESQGQQNVMEASDSELLGAKKIEGTPRRRDSSGRIPIKNDGISGRIPIKNFKKYFHVV